MTDRIARAFCLEVKAVEQDGNERVIRGVATTPDPDRMGDVVEPLGATFKNPLPLLWQHKHDQPVGTVEFDAPTAKGIRFTARLAEVADAGKLRDRVDEAWQSVKAGLIKAVSIGFRAVEDGIEPLKTGGLRFTKSEILELSLVTIPANAGATIDYVRSLDADLLAASGFSQKHSSTDEDPPGVTGKSKKPVSLRQEAKPMKKTLADQISALEEKREANADRMEEILQKTVEEDRSTDEAEQEEFDTLEAENESIDADLKRFKSLQRSKVASAKPVEKAESVEDGTRYRAPVQVKRTETLDPGIRFARLVKCLGTAQGSRSGALEIAKARYEHDDALVNVLKTAVAAGTTSSTTWAGNLVGDETSVFADFVEYLRPMTILGKFGTMGVPALRRVPFRTALIGQTGGGAGYWVGEGKAKPLTSFAFSRTTLEPLKVANIAVLTEEVIRDSSPSAEMIVRDQLAEALRTRMDTDFISVTKTASAGVSPASITNGVTPINSGGNTAALIREDIRQAVNAFVTANNRLGTGVWVMSEQTAVALSLMNNALGQSEFPTITRGGGTLVGFPVITSEYVAADSNGSFVHLVNAGDIYVADDGDIAVDMSREASLEMDTAPTMDASAAGPTETTSVSLWQTNAVGFRAERTINWSKRRTEAVTTIDYVHWGEP